MWSRKASPVETFTLPRPSSPTLATRRVSLLLRVTALFLFKFEPHSARFDQNVRLNAPDYPIYAQERRNYSRYSSRTSIACACAPNPSISARRTLASRSISRSLRSRLSRLLRFKNVCTPRGDENRAAPEVGSVWLGPAV